MLTFPFELNIKASDADAGCPGGMDAEEGVRYLMGLPYIARQLKKLSPEKVRLELKEYGAWDEDELADHDKNLMRVVWISCCNLKEELEEKRRGRGRGRAGRTCICRR
jgi:hypothetical protein